MSTWRWWWWWVWQTEKVKSWNNACCKKWVCSCCLSGFIIEIDDLVIQPVLQVLWSDKYFSKSQWSYLDFYFLISDTIKKISEVTAKYKHLKIWVSVWGAVQRRLSLWRGCCFILPPGCLTKPSHWILWSLLLSKTPHLNNFNASVWFLITLSSSSLLCPPLRQYLGHDVSLSEDAVHKYSDIVLAKLNKIIVELRRLFLVEDLVDSIKVRMASAHTDPELVRDTGQKKRL